MRILGQVEPDNASSYRGTTTTNGLPVTQIRTSKPRAAANTTANIHIACTSVCRKSIKKSRVMFIAAAVVPQVEIQHRKRKSIL